MKRIATMAAVLVAAMMSLCGCATGLRTTGSGFDTGRTFCKDVGLRHGEYFTMTIDTNGTRHIECMVIDGLGSSASNGTFTLGRFLTGALGLGIGLMAPGSGAATSEILKDGAIGTVGGLSAGDIWAKLTAMFEKAQAQPPAATTAPVGASYPVPIPSAGSGSGPAAVPLDPNAAPSTGSGPAPTNVTP